MEYGRQEQSGYRLPPGQIIQERIPGDSEKAGKCSGDNGRVPFAADEMQFAKTGENMVSKGRSEQLLGIHNFLGKLKFIG